MIPTLNWQLYKKMDSKSSNKSVGAGIAWSVKRLGYRLEDRANMVTLPAEQRCIPLSQNIQTETGDKTTSYSVGNKGIPGYEEAR
jgi:hypothetical protein